MQAGIPDEAQELVVLWRLRKEDGIASAVVWSHAAGAELRILADGHLVRSRVFVDLDQLIEYARAEQNRLDRRGWILSA